MSKRVFFAVCLIVIVAFESAYAAGWEPNAFEINKIEMIESAAEKKAVEQRDATAP